MLQLRFTSCKADPCVWLREMKDKYEHIAIYVDDLLIASEEPQNHPRLERKVQAQNQRLWTIGIPS